VSLSRGQGGLAGDALLAKAHRKPCHANDRLIINGDRWQATRDGSHLDLTRREISCCRRCFRPGRVFSQRSTLSSSPFPDDTEVLTEPSTVHIRNIPAKIRIGQHLGPSPLCLLAWDTRFSRWDKGAARPYPQRIEPQKRTGAHFLKRLHFSLHNCCNSLLKEHGKDPVNGDLTPTIGEPNEF